MYRAQSRTPVWIHETGGSPRQVTQLDADLTENSHRGPEFLPDGRRFLFTSRCAQCATTPCGGVARPERRRMPAEAHASFVPPGTGRSCCSTRGCVGGAPPRCGQRGVHRRPDPRHRCQLWSGQHPGGFRVSGDANVIIVRPAGREEPQLTWFRRDGEAVGTVGPLGGPNRPRISPSGDVLFVATVREPATVTSGTPSSPRHHHESHDAHRQRLVSGVVAIGSQRPGVPGVCTWSSFDPGRGRNPAGAGNTARLVSRRAVAPLTKIATYGCVGVTSAQDAFAFIDTPAWEANGRFSPDGKWLLFPMGRV